MVHKNGPWIIKNTKCIYKNSWMDVREDDVIRPDGKKGIFGVVTLKPGITVLPVDNEGNIYLIEQYHYVMEKKTIEAVSGGIEESEGTLDAAKRELKEEVGIEAKNWIDLGVINPLTAIVDSKNYLFLAKDLTFINSSQDGTENIKLIKVSFKQAIGWVMEGKITSSVTATILFKAKNLL